MKKIKEYKNIIITALVIIVVIIAYKYNHKTPEVTKSIASEKSSALTNSLTDEEIKSEIDTTLEVLMTIHYVSVIDKKTDDPNSVILDELQEAMNDSNKLKGILYKTESLSKSGNEIIATTGLVLNVSTLKLIKSYDVWINYLRTVDMNNIDVSEFQYQMALFQSSTHDAYLKLVEGSSLLPMVTVEFAKEKGGENTINEDLKNHFLAKMDRSFNDILIDNDRFYKETKNRWAIAILIQGYKDFFSSPKTR